MGITIWLVPPEGPFKPLEALIAEIASKHSSPVFQPHITLLALPSDSPITSDAILPPLSELPATIPITFNKVCAGQSYFQSVLVELEIKDGSTLDELYKATLKKNEGLVKGEDASSELGGRFLRPFYPHLSLYYGEVSAEVRSAIIKGLVDEGKVQPAGVHSPLTIVGVEGGFQVTDIWVVKCDGPTRDWQVLEKIKLS
ncbi:hypothetical protein FRB94_010257 [Tulasnella sp. JGI-2019a]|nr:hypothetical protein FRB94_010257 [Tulasnella sp. JGI-2019a]KAG9012374.1 hypothetical protein FRB93_001797 [Tulasnella sp. JGI-2019a]